MPDPAEFDGRPRSYMPEGLPVGDLPADVASALGRRAAVREGRELLDAAAQALPMLGAGTCNTSCAGPCEPGQGQHTAAGRPGERVFTLGEAVAELARRECAMSGHDWEVMASDYLDRRSDPVAVACGRGCGVKPYRCVPVGGADTRELLTSVMLDLWSDLGAAYDRSPADPPESSIECTALITRIVDLVRETGTAPAELVPPWLITTGIYELVNKRAGREVTIAPCTRTAAAEHVEARDRARGVVADA